MSVKFVKDFNTVPVYVSSFGYSYSYGPERSKSRRVSYVTIRQLEVQDAISVDVKDVPALITALEAAAAHANKQADAKALSTVSLDNE